MTVFLAHDGSLNGDWIARYALHIAAGTVEQRLVVAHVEDANISGEPLHARLERLAGLGERMGVAVEVRILPMQHGVFGGLDAHLRGEAGALVVCGARAQGGRRGMLSGTISERLLRQREYDVLSIHVLQPGLLGDPKRVLLALDGDDAVTGGAAAAVPFVKPLVSGIERLDVVYVETVSHWRFAHLSDAEAGRLRHAAQAIVDRAEAVLTDEMPLDRARMDTHVRVSDDWPKQIAVEAGRYRSGLTLLEMPPLHSRGLSFSHPVESLMRNAPSDVAVYRKAGRS